MEEIDIGQLLNYFKSKIIYIIFAMSIAFCLSSIYVNRFRVPEYTSYTTILINNESAQVNSSEVDLGKKLVSTYGEIIKSKSILRTVIDNLSLDMSYSALVGKIGVSAVTDTSIIKVSVTNKDPQVAADIANQIATVFSAEVVEIYKIENVSVIDVAEASEIASSASTIKIIGISTLAGAFLSIAIIFAVFYLDKTVKEEEDIEKATGLPVIGIVPVSREKIKGSAHRKYYEEAAKKHRSQEILPVEREVRRIEADADVNTEKEIGMTSIPIKKEPKADVVSVKSTASVGRHAAKSKDDDDSDLNITKALEDLVSQIEKEEDPSKLKSTTVKKNYYKKSTNKK